jgi:hypothetical protein
MEDVKEYGEHSKELIANSEAATVPQKMSESTSFFDMVERLASRPDIPVEKIQQLMEMQEHILDRNAKQAFNASMVEAQSGIKLVVAKKWNAQTKSKYANLEAILMEAAPIYTAAGFSLLFYEGDTDKKDHKRVCVDIMHSQGHTESRYGDFAIQTTGIAGKKMMTEIHGEGSAFTYGRRYLTCMIFNIPTGDDDDGNAAGGVPVVSEKQTSQIYDMINSKGVDEDEFLKYMGFESVETIPASQFGKAMNVLKKAKGNA